MSDNSSYTIFDLLAFLFGVIMLFGFFFLTWFFVPGITLDRSVAGVQIMSPITSINLTVLVPIAAVIGMITSAWGISDDRVRRYTQIAMRVGGLLGVIYYVLFFLYNGKDAYFRVFGLQINQNLLDNFTITPTNILLDIFNRNLLSGVGFGFWLCLAISLFFVFMPASSSSSATATTVEEKPDPRKTLLIAETARPAPINSRDRVLALVYTIPWWALVLVLIGIFVTVNISNDALYSNIYRQLRAGVALTLRVSFTAYGGALVIGLVIGMIRSSPPKPPTGDIFKSIPSMISALLSFLHLAIYNISTLLVEVLRGLPILIVLLVSAFIVIPEVRNYLNETYDLGLNWRGSGVETAIIALALAYGSFLSEIFRAGIQSVEKGQIEAAKSVGMTYAQTMRFIVLPQAVRRVLPPLGNDFVAMLKDSSLVAILGIRDVTQIARVSSGSSFRYLETYLTVAVIYLMMTVLGSLCIRVLEGYLRQDSR
ncbi:MAG: amino acid ABC transporter permease [Aggregatilineales bacterium]